MAGYDRTIDPLTKDYVSDGAGGYVKTRGLATACYHQLQTDQDRWVGDPDAGNESWKVPRKRTDANVQRIAEAFRSCLQVFVKDGRGAGLIVQIGEDETGRAVISTRMQDLQAGKGTPLDLTPMLPFGA